MGFNSPIYLIRPWEFDITMELSNTYYSSIRFLCDERMLSCCIICVCATVFTPLNIVMSYVPEIYIMHIENIFRDTIATK